MTQQELYDLYQRYRAFIAEQASIKLRKQKFGFTFEQALPQHAQLIQQLVLQQILAVNQPLQPAAPVREPYWLTQAALSSFLSKIAVVCAP